MTAGLVVTNIETAEPFAANGVYRDILMLAPITDRRRRPMARISLHISFAPTGGSDATPISPFATIGAGDGPRANR